MKDCPGEISDEEKERALMIAEEERLRERPFLHRTVDLIIDRETIEGKVLRELGNKITGHPPVKKWDLRMVTSKERDRGIGVPTPREQFDRDMKAKEHRKRAMSECGAPKPPPKPKPRRCSNKPKLDNWLGRRRSRARASMLVHRTSVAGAQRGSALLQRGSIFFDHKRESIRRASVRRESQQLGGIDVAALEAAKTVTGVNLDNVVDTSFPVQVASDSLGKYKEKVDNLAANTGPLWDPRFFRDWKVYKHDMPYTKFFRTEDYLQNPLSTYKAALHNM